MKIAPILYLLIALTQAPALAQSSADTGLKSYRCAVLGESSACAPAAALPGVRVEERYELGPRAKYLIHQGMDRESAIEQARLYGEHPVRRTVRVTTRSLSSAEVYDRAMGRPIAPHVLEETLQLTVDGPVAPDRASAGG